MADHHIHHLLPLILALILLILPSSSHASNQTDGLFSEPYDFLVSGNNLTDGNQTLSLQPDCGLYYYVNGTLVKNFQTNTDSTGCILTINYFGQLVLDKGDGTQPQTLGTAGALGFYALLLTDDLLGVYGPRTWSNGILRSRTLKNKNLKQATSNNFIYSDNSIDGVANGNATIATNEGVTAYITQKCTLSVKNSAGIIWESTPSINGSYVCYLWLTNRGPLLLQYEDSKGLQTQWTGGVLGEKNKYVAVLRSYGGIDIYGLKDGILDIPPVTAAVAKNIKMVTA
ncbi:mannose-specific lectin 1-like [Dioscorea cayenensis subsp. rotundata]|uniref:Mannose-specific lectin 1-like n=1 Tax=Dioscorea cayennensis subsp. rotundata TaxID=55577 RepID=A0AB40C1W8_DIOCR|nr:mannose-specific lectin 1-like [Dioscorea cayenensis subsp. rotundata]